MPYTDDILSAYESLSDAGGLLTLYRLTSGYDPVAPQEDVVRTLNASQTLAGVQFPANRSKTGRFDKTVTEGLKQTSIRFFMLAAYGHAFVPRPGDVIKSFTDEMMTLLGVNVLEPGGIPIYFEALAVIGAQEFTISFITSEFIGLDVTDTASFLTDEEGNPILLD